MKYTVEYVTEIAIHKYGENDKKKIYEYLKNFDPSKAEYKDDEEKFLKTQKSDQDRKNVWKNLNEIAFYIIYYYAPKTNMYGFHQKVNGRESLVDKLLKNCFLDRPIDYDQKIPYHQHLADFSAKYNIHLNPESIIATLRTVADQEENREELYKTYYKALFVSNYTKLGENFDKIDELMRDFEKIMKGIREEAVPELNEDKLDYGGMDRKELKEFMVSLRETDCNLTAKAQKELQKTDFKTFARTASVALEDAPNNEEIMIQSVARLQVMLQTHAERNTVFKILHPFQYRAEQKAIDELNKQIKDLSSEEEVDTLLRRPSIYTKNFEKERTRIESFVENVDIVDSKSMPAIDEVEELDVEKDLGYEIIKTVPEIEEPAPEQDRGFVLTGLDEENEVKAVDEESAPSAENGPSMGK